ncbi:GNAT family N-acetyltransferase [Nostoc sp. 'Peltigera membranacea cyanobiont' N6]|uniref:GNAT family N-acetyltransferase n=1 Tax=Nostoc sp. 'Peltigera membranacea cyanobiont' N6 TaxID=1261031 RepID=UPI000CF348AF|nr:GNAT family N-acetyltransferase [Nostoc sp. 'Peltigera membranacea cyanobiont' N6]AVH64285.1 GCN5-related N-acetyltransferase [Nostoc sp. 'Peltigera membranacea cyanobiont' N6]
MQLHRFDNIQEFWHCTQAYLLQHQVENNVLLSVSHTLLHNPERYVGKPYLAIVQTSGEILAVAIRTPPQKLILSKAQNMDALRLIAQDLHQEQLPGSMGLAQEVEIFSQTWQTLTGQFYQQSVLMKIYQLTAVQRVSKARGYLRLATEGDRSLLIEWLSAFFSEIDEAVSQDVQHQVDNRLKQQNTYFWVDSTPVSVASCKQVLPTIGRINLAYTPPEYRRKGYATACVAALSQKLLDQGCRDCFLIADLANPTANHIYQAIGYRPICDWHEYSFTSNE